MKMVDEKLLKFSSDIMENATSQRDTILNSSEEAYKKIYNEKETEYLTKAYETIQEGLKKIDKEKNSIVSKMRMDNKMALLNKRNEIVEYVFNSAKAKLYEMVASEAYYPYLVKMITEDLDAVGEGEKEIIINHKDQGYINALEKTFDYPIVLENRKIDMIGGCKILNKTKNIYLDDSFDTKLESQREAFLRICKIDIGQ